MADWFTIAVSLIGGGACGALLTERFRRKRTLTQTIPLIERVNRDPIRPGIKGIRLFRESATGKLSEVKNIREYQMTLQNTSENDLGDAELHFEFLGDSVDAWSSRTKLGNISLNRIEDVQTSSEAGYKFVRWQFPQFPSGDSVELSFQVLEPTSSDYEVAIYKASNVVIAKTKQEPFVEYFKKVERTSQIFRSIVVFLTIMAIVGFLFLEPNIVLAARRLKESIYNSLAHPPANP